MPSFLQTTLKVSDTAGPVNLVDVHSPAGNQCSVQFDHTQYFSHLPQHVELGSTLLAASQLQSTQTLLQDNTAVTPDNTVCIAYKQVGGKGITTFALSQNYRKHCDAAECLCCRQRREQMGLSRRLFDVLSVQESERHRYYKCNLATPSKLCTIAFLSCRCKHTFCSVHCHTCNCAGGSAACKR